MRESKLNMRHEDGACPIARTHLAGRYDLNDRAARQSAFFERPCSRGREDGPFQWTIISGIVDFWEGPLSLRVLP